LHFAFLILHFAFFQSHCRVTRFFFRSMPAAIRTGVGSAMAHRPLDVGEARQAIVR
jgi:hypothetical protein